MPKHVSFPGRPSRRPVDTGAIDRFVGVSPPAAPTKRLTANVPEDVHRRLKRYCFEQEVTISEFLTKFLEERFPEES